MTLINSTTTTQQHNNNTTTTQQQHTGYKRAVTCKVGVIEDIGIKDTRKTIQEAAQNMLRECWRHNICERDKRGHFEAEKAL